MLGGRSPFVAPLDKRDEADAAKRMFSEDQSDHLTNLNAFNGTFIFISVVHVLITLPLVLLGSLAPDGEKNSAALEVQLIISHDFN